MMESHMTLLYLLLITVIDVCVALPSAYTKRCYGKTCVDFKIVRKFDENLELRCYNESTWASVWGKGSRYKKSHKLQTWRLFRYISGGNDQHQQVVIGSPFMRLFDDTKHIYTIEFLLPGEINHNHLPKPRDHKVRVAKRGPFCAYVHANRDWIHNTSSVEMFHERAKRMIGERHLDHDCHMDFYFYALYGNMYGPGENLNEIWYLQRNHVTKDKVLGNEAVGPRKFRRQVGPGFFSVPT